MQPTVRFYSKNGQRSVSILEGGEAQLPLRLTGNAVSKLLPSSQIYLISISLLLALDT